jgi:hypothetical protein
VGVHVGAALRKRRQGKEARDAPRSVGLCQERREVVCKDRERRVVTDTRALMHRGRWKDDGTGRGAGPTRKPYIMHSACGHATRVASPATAHTYIDHLKTIYAGREINCTVQLFLFCFD